MDIKTLARQLQEDEASGSGADSSAKAVERSGRKPFLALKDTVRAASEDVLRLYEQGGSVSSTAYLHFAAAEELAVAEGSSNALLPYLTPTVLRLYVSKPERCGTSLAERLYDLSLSLYGTEALQACHYTLYQALQATFSWVRDNIALRLQEVEGQPFATAAWPDLDLYPDLEFAAVVYDALSNEDKLGSVGELVETSCGMERADFAILIPRISAVLQEMHADLPLLQQIAGSLHDTHYSAAGGRGDHRRRSALERWSEKRLAEGHDGGGVTAAAQLRALGVSASSSAGVAAAGGDAAECAEAGVRAARAEEAQGCVQPSMLDAGTDEGPHLDLDQDQDTDLDLRLETEEAARQRRALLSSNTFYSMPAAGYVKMAPSVMPRVLVPLIFHIMLYQDGTSIGPAKYDQAASYVARLVHVGNIMAKPTNFQFFVKEVRNNPTTYSYLLLKDRAAWLKIPSLDNLDSSCTGSCFNNATYMAQIVADWPRSINIFVASDSTSGVPLGYAYVPGSDLEPYHGHVFISWDSIIYEGSNSLRMYDDGPNTLVHEVFHHFGVYHPFGSGSELQSCTDEDYVIDTPATFLSIGSSSFYGTAGAYCMELFWGQYGGDWTAAYDRWSTTLGIPDTDRNAWADSCPSLPGFDELGNYMTYNTPVCFAALGHFTPGQAQRAHLITSELNPVLYAWGQYYAQNAPPPPPMASPPPEVLNNTCRVTAKSLCACKSSWTLNDLSYSYCDRISATNNSLSCQVQDPSTCPDCDPSSTSACILPCGGTARMCKRSVAPGTKMPPPPPPSSPAQPPYPPPPPPRAVPSACKKSLSGCDCRSTWVFGSYFYSYCASPDGDKQLWCQVSSTCAGFSSSSPYRLCNTTLNVTYCGGPVSFSTTRVPPAPPAPPPDFRPRPPPLPRPSSVAEVRGSFTLNANCSLLSANKTALTTDILQSLSQALGTGIDNIAITSMRCGSIIVDYVVSFVAGSSSSEVTSVSAAASSLQLPTSFTSKWGAVTTSSSNIVVLDSNQLCPPGSPATELCPAGPPPPQSRTAAPPPPKDNSSGGLSTIVIICIAVGGGLALILVILLTVILAVRKRGKVAPRPQQGQTQPPPAAPLPYPMAPPGGGAYPGATAPYNQQRQQPNYQPTFQQTGYPQQQPAYQQPSYQQPSYQQPSYQQPAYPAY